ncbi:ankyrin [Ceraceosorus guamensis]|uniref:Ankyrin n=1 Tax=Ceraceosorus guamensis TaxID=1522189 RepID=A0A316W6J4_9BASI|nr:ankyrin [Ceraceosorus guamensis]PWN43673.1 ankyrin [Ceraceosorus guamensis]
MADEAGANADEQLRHAARTDSVELYDQALATESGVDFSSADGLGNTALHLAVTNQSTQVLERLLEEEVDVDLPNRKGDTPLHLAVAGEPGEARVWIVEQLLECGADPREVNKDGDKPAEIVAEGNSEEGQSIKALLREAEGKVNISNDDIADEDDDDDDDGPPSED